MTVKPIKYSIDIPGIKETDFQPTSPSSKWGILTCHWPKIIDEKEVESFKTRNIPVKEVHDPKGITWVADCTSKVVFNLKTKKTYCDDDKSIIAGKFAVLLTPGTPLICLAKTIYHIFFPLSIVYEVHNILEKAKENDKKIPPDALAKKVITIIAKNFADIILTPLYAVAMTIIALASVLLCPINTNLLYEGRALYGELLLSLHWNDKNATTLFAPCMLPQNDLSEKGRNEKKRIYEMKDTFYAGQAKGSAIHGLTNSTRKFIIDIQSKREDDPNLWARVKLKN